MDSLQYLKEKLGLDALFPSQAKTSRSGFCCISILPSGFAIVKTEAATNGGNIKLSLREFIACKRANLAEALAAEVTKHKLDNTHCTWILPPENYQLILLEKLPVPDVEFQAAIRWKIKDLITFPTDDAVIDSFNVPPSNIASAKKNIMVAVSQLSYLQPLADIINESGLNLTIVDINELALRNIASLYEQDDNSVAMIFLQEKSSKIIVTRQKTFYFSRRLDWGLNVVSDAAQDSEIIDRNIDKLSLEIQRSFDYYQSQWRLPAPTKILLAPEIAPAIDIRSYLIKRLTTAVQDLDLNDILDCTPSLDKKQQGQFLPVIGGALSQEINTHATTD
jgi:MSHA biogenesis protein MshI